MAAELARPIARASSKRVREARTCGLQTRRQQAALEVVRYVQDAVLHLAQNGASPSVRAALAKDRRGGRAS